MAARRGAVVPLLMIIEPGYWRELDASARQIAFMGEPIIDTPRALQPLDAVDAGSLPSAADMGLADDGCIARQSRVSPSRRCHPGEARQL